MYIYICIYIYVYINIYVHIHRKYHNGYIRMPKKTLQISPTAPGNHQKLGSRTRAQHLLLCGSGLENFREMTGCPANKGCVIYIYIYSAWWFEPL